MPRGGARLGAHLNGDASMQSEQGTQSEPELKVGTRVAVEDYGVRRYGRVARVGQYRPSIVFVVLGGTSRERWFHRHSLTVA